MGFFKFLILVLAMAFAVSCGKRAERDGPLTVTQYQCAGDTCEECIDNECKKTKIEQEQEQKQEGSQQQEGKVVVIVNSENRSDSNSDSKAEAQSCSANYDIKSNRTFTRVVKCGNKKSCTASGGWSHDKDYPEAINLYYVDNDCDRIESETLMH